MIVMTMPHTCAAIMDTFKNSQLKELSQDHVDTAHPEEKTRFKWLKKYLEFQPNISTAHCITYFTSVMIIITAFVFMDNSQADYIELAMNRSDDKGTTQGSLLLADEILSVCLLPIWGFLSDFTGRRVLYSCGFLFLGLGTLLYPFASLPFPVDFKTFFCSLLFFRFIFAIGSSIVGSLMAAMLSDMSSESCNGRFAGVVGFFCGLGAIIGVVVIPRLPIWVSKNRNPPLPRITSLYISHYIMAGILFLTSILVLLFISSNSVKEQQDDSNNCNEEEKSFNSVDDHSDLERDQKPYFKPHEHPCRSRTQLMKRNIRLSIMASTHPMISLSYISAFVARTTTLIYNGFYTQWFGAMNDGRSASLRGTLSIVTLIFSPFYGFFSNKVSGVVSISMACFFCIVAHSIMLLIDSESKLQYLVAIFAGIAQAGFTISGLALVSHYAPKYIRGAVSGAYGFCGGLGILVNSQLVGTLFDTWTHNAPFIILMIWSGVLIISAIAASIIMRSKNPGQYRM